MTNRRTLVPTILAAALLALCLPVLAAAQGTYDPYGRDRDYRRNNGGNYDNRALRDSIRRLSDLSGRFQNDLDRALDRSRVDGTRREDNINEEAREFRRAANDLKNRFGDGRDLYRSQSEAQRVLELGQRLQRVTRLAGYDQRIASDWSQISQELNFIASVYGNNGYNNNGNYPSGRNRNNYPRTNNNVPWWRRLPY
ncbi:MAG: hypothetical protein WBP93_17265 [Pyrinomonadaceae bacterium]